MKRQFDDLSPLTVKQQTLVYHAIEGFECCFIEMSNFTFVVGSNPLGGRTRAEISAINRHVALRTRHRHGRKEVPATPALDTARRIMVQSFLHL